MYQRMREFNFLINILGTLVSGAILVYVNSVNAKLDEQQKSATELNASVIKIQEYIKFNQLTVNRLEDKQRVNDAEHKKLNEHLSDIERKAEHVR